MARSLLVALLGVVAAVAAPVPKVKTKDYQRMADETEWTFAEFSFERALAVELKEYALEGVFDAAGAVVTISNDKSERLLSWHVHQHTPFAQRNGVLYYADFSPISSGCSVVAFDLNAKKPLWTAELKGLGPIGHSKYRNEVRLEVFDGNTLRVFGKESSGRYVEFVDRGTGKSVGHKVFDEKK